MFICYDGNDIIGHLCSPVDEFNYAGTDEWKEKAIESIKRKLKIRTENKGSFMYLGLNVQQNKDGISIDQKHYIDKLEEIPNPKKKLNEERLSIEEKSQLRSLSGQMLWVTNQTRPDAGFETCMMSNAGKTPIVKQLKEANKAVRKLKNSNDVKIKIPNLGLTVVVHGNANHANLADGSSQGAFIVFVCGNGRMTPILWKSKKLRRVTKSPLASEILAVGEASDAAILVANSIREVYRLDNLPPVVCYTDSKSLIENLKSSNTVEDMSVRVEVARLREMVSLKEIVYKWVKSQDNLADVMTKRTASPEELLGVLDKAALSH